MILFDEVEKAHPDVFNVLLQVLDDGRLTDGQGRTVDFRNTMIVLTSNLGSEYLAALPDGAPATDAREQVMSVVRSAFRPEFLNRLDEVILFNRLGRAQMKDIVAIQLGRLRKLLADRRMSLELTERALEWLGNAGYDPVYGARPLKRVIQRSLQDPLALMLLEGRLADGETVRVDAGEDGLVIQGAADRGGRLERLRAAGPPAARPPPARPPPRRCRSISSRRAANRASVGTLQRLAASQVDAQRVDLAARPRSSS